MLSLTLLVGLVWIAGALTDSNTPRDWQHGHAQSHKSVPVLYSLSLFIILYFIGVCMSVYYCGIDSCSIKETFEFNWNMWVCTLYSWSYVVTAWTSRPNVSRRCFELLVSDWCWWHWRLGLVSVSSQARDSDVSVSASYTPHSQPCALASLCQTLARVKFWGATTPKGRNNSLQKKSTWVDPNLHVLLSV